MKTYVSVLILASAIVLPQGAHAERSDGFGPPPVPDAIQVPPEFTPYLAAHAIGTQGYVCVAVNSVFSWTHFGPQAQVSRSSSDPSFVEPGAIPWLLLEAVVVGDGPTWGVPR